MATEIERKTIYTNKCKGVIINVDCNDNVNEATGHFLCIKYPNGTIARKTAAAHPSNVNKIQYTLDGTEFTVGVTGIHLIRSEISYGGDILQGVVDRINVEDGWV